MSQERLFFNRLTQSWLEDEPLGEVLSSELVVRGPVVIDRRGFEDSVLLVDNGEGVAAVARDEFKMSVPLFIGDRRDSIHASLDVSKRMNSHRESKHSIAATIQEVDPIILLNNITDLLNQDPIETSLKVNVARLRGVFHSPFSELDYVAERVPAPRAKRISRRAVQVLSAHSEDWLKASGSGVTPRRIEALERDEILDIYENRVAARLIDDVRRHLKRLLEEDQNLQTLLQEIQGPFRKTMRLASVWGRQTPSEKLREAQLSRHDRIKGLLGLVEEFRDSRLYAGVPRRARVSQPIRVTNLLDQDLNYRGVRRLWVEWWDSRNSRGGPEEFRTNLLNETKAFYDLTWLIVCRAISNVDGFELHGPSLESAISFRSNWGSFRLQKRNTFDEGSWELVAESGGDKDSILVIALACQLLQGTSTDVRSRLNRIVNQIDRNKFKQILICFPGTISDADSYSEIEELASLLNPISSRLVDNSRNIWLVPISPLDIESTERVERVVRWTLLGGSLLQYPVKIQTSKAVCDFVEGMAFASISRNGSALVVSQAMSQKELTRFDSEVNQRVRMLQGQQRSVGAAEAKALGVLSSELKSALDRIRLWSVCPICSAGGSLSARSSDTFESTCNICECRWGLRHDARSNDRVPFIWLGDGLAEIPRGSDLSRWLGRDVLAEPCRHAEAEYGTEVINPWTGVCTGLGEFSSECNRCIMQG